MNEFIVEALSLIAVLLFGPLWYAEYNKRRQLEADIEVEKQRKKLNEIREKLDSTPLPAYTEHAIPDYMYDFIRKPDSSDPGDDSGSEGGSGGTNSGLQ
jgi:hypothetical protein